MIILKEIKHKIFKKENFYFLMIILLTFGVDRYSKIDIINNFNEKTFYVNSFINFDLIWNTGIGFGFLSTNSTIIYNLITSVIGIIILILIYVSIFSKKIDKFIFSIIIGGALGNFYDRIVYRAVPDFIDLHYLNFHWFTFNVADIFISIGIVIFILTSFFIKNENI